MTQPASFNFSYCSDPLFKLNVMKRKVEEQCDICLLTEWNPLRYGEFVVKKCKSPKDLRCHYFCLLTATHIPQRGSSSAGITGFLIRDITDSFHRFRERPCAYCSKPSAPIKCSHEGCTRWFHFICGYKNACVSQFCDSFKSYCHRHLPEEQRTPRRPDRECEICWDVLPQATDTAYNPVAILRTCWLDECPRGGLLHRECLQQFAYSAGYNFRCPCCLSKEYRRYAEQCGIFIPNRDSSWEREPGAFKGMYKNKCTSNDCEHSDNASEEMVGCVVCGGGLKHKACTKLTDPASYLCEACMDETFIKKL